MTGVTDHIFEQIVKSEYFLFIDFKREKLNTGIRIGDRSERHRGSLFSHQELAIAAFLQKEVIAFKERGVRLEGISKFILANALEFSHRKSLPKRVMDKVSEQWDPTWWDELNIQRDNNDKDIGICDREKNRMANYFHVKVKNRHKAKVARNCVAFVSRIRKPDGSVLTPELVELKWKGIISHDLSIPPGQYRSLDVFHAYWDSPSVGYLGINPFIFDFSSYGAFYKLCGPGRFEIDIVVYSDTFESVCRTYVLDLGKTMDEISLELKQ